MLTSDNYWCYVWNTGYLNLITGWWVIDTDHVTHLDLSTHLTQDSRPRDPLSALLRCRDHRDRVHSWSAVIQRSKRQRTRGFVNWCRSESVSRRSTPLTSSSSSSSSSRGRMPALSHHSASASVNLVLRCPTISRPIFADFRLSTVWSVSSGGSKGLTCRRLAHYEAITAHPIYELARLRIAAQTKRRNCLSPTASSLHKIIVKKSL